jgi:oxygen-independent coproporphyrinogen-3 oxidase
MDNKKCGNMKTEFTHNSGKMELGLYIHIPFCVRKCDYCDFLSAPASKETVDAYFAAMLTELEQYKGLTQDYIVPTVFIGGGTPSCVDAEYIEAVMEAVGRIFKLDRQKLEATIELNPGTVKSDKLKAYQRAGINRLSFGLQSADNEELLRLGRIHTYEQFEENYQLARSLEFTNINIDLMSAIPGQTQASWENTLKKIIALNPEHISAYSLIVEEGTKFYERYREGTKGYAELPDEDTDRLMYHRTKEILKANGYHRYEISNYAKETYECRHNSSYWIGTDYLGIGLGAASLLQGARFSNLRELTQYLNLCDIYRKKCDTALSSGNGNTVYAVMGDRIGIRTDYSQLTQHQKMEEFMFLGLRLTKGISKTLFSKRFGTGIEEAYGAVIKRMLKEHLLEIEGDRIRLTEYGTDISNYVLAEFLFDDETVI